MFQSKSVKFFVLLVCLTLVQFSFGQDIDTLLGTLKTYDYGDSREPLSQLSDVIKSSFEDSAKRAQIEAKLDAFIESDATFAAKQFICKELSIVGTEASVPALSKLLKADKTADMARYALERIPGESVDKALIKAGKKAKGVTKIGIINTLGTRETDAAVKLLSKTIKDKDAQIAQASAAALGKIATPKAISVLEKAIGKTSGETKEIVLNAYLDSAEKMDAKTAQGMYHSLRSDEYSLPIRTAALTGCVKVSEDKMMVINAVLKSDMDELKSTAISLLRCLPADASLKDVMPNMESFSALEKIQLLAVVQDRQDKTVHDQVAKALQCKDQNVRLAALRTLVAVGNETDIDELVDIIVNGSQNEKEQATETLNMISTDAFDQTLVEKVDGTDDKAKVELVKALGARNADTSIKKLLETATDENRRVRAESYKSLAIVACPKALDTLVDLLIAEENNGVRKEAEKTVVTVSLKNEGDNKGQVVLEKMDKAETTDAQASLLQVLGRIGDTNALPVLRKNLNGKNKELKLAAIRALSEWPNAEPLNDLKTVVEKDKDTAQILALRGFIDLVRQDSENRDSAESLELLKTAMDYAVQSNEKRKVLSALGEVKGIEAFRYAASFLDNDELKAEAEVAAATIARSTGNDHPEETKKVLTKIQEQTKNDELKRQLGWALRRF